MTTKHSLTAVFSRNRFLTAVISASFLSTMVIAATVTYLVLVTSPDFVKSLVSWFPTIQAYVTIPKLYTFEFYRFIFLNNIGHFWNPVHLWVWIPFIGAFDLGYELLSNAIVIGAAASFVTITKGPVYTFLGLVPHGIIEVPAFILEFTALARWHITTTRALYTKLNGRAVDRPLLREGVKDTVFLSLLSVGLFAVAAYVETFVTPHLIGR
jgi:uncharacterized membrane protein SpoIIM required for sporulation